MVTNTNFTSSSFIHNGKGILQIENTKWTKLLSQNQVKCNADILKKNELYFNDKRKIVTFKLYYQVTKLTIYGTWRYTKFEAVYSLSIILHNVKP
jgi:hypothetical protein